MAGRTAVENEVRGRSSPVRGIDGARTRGDVCGDTRLVPRPEPNLDISRGAFHLSREVGKSALMIQLRKAAILTA